MYTGAFYGALANCSATARKLEKSLHFLSLLLSKKIIIGGIIVYIVKYHKKELSV
jgi:hypothetical protein